MITIRIPSLRRDFINQVEVSPDEIQGDMVPDLPLRNWLQDKDHTIRWIEVPNGNNPMLMQLEMVVDLEDADAVAFKLTFDL